MTKDQDCCTISITTFIPQGELLFFIYNSTNIHLLAKRSSSSRLSVEDPTQILPTNPHPTCHLAARAIVFSASSCACFACCQQQCQSTEKSRHPNLTTCKTCLAIRTAPTFGVAQGSLQFQKHASNSNLPVAVPWEPEC